MRISIITEARLSRGADGTVWTRPPNGYSFWSRYLDVFDEVNIIARVAPGGTCLSGTTRVDGPSVRVSPVAHYVGVSEFVSKALAIRNSVRQTRPADAIILRAPSTLANIAAGPWLDQQRPLGIEVVGDPDEVFGPEGIGHPLRPLFRLWYSRHLRRQCRRAVAVSYVTERTLQRKYPCSPQAFATSYSSVELPSSEFVERPRTMASPAGSAFTIVTVASLEQLYKGTDTLIAALSKCGDTPKPIALKILGDGVFRNQLERQAHSLGVRCEFLGHLPGRDAVRRVLDASDLFVLPSRTEGLPRSMIEAMARGLPCIGSTVGGIPELLPQEAMVPPGDSTALAKKILAALENPTWMAAMAGLNLQKARAFHSSELSKRRASMYASLRDATAQWISRRRGIASSAAVGK